MRSMSACAAEQVRLDHRAHASAIARDALDDVQSAIGVGGRFHVDFETRPGLAGFASQRPNVFQAGVFGKVQSHLGELERDGGRKSSRGELIRAPPDRRRGKPRPPPAKLRFRPDDPAWRECFRSGAACRPSNSCSRVSPATNRCVSLPRGRRSFHPFPDGPCRERYRKKSRINQSKIGSGDRDCARPPSHTTGRAVFRIRRLNPAALGGRKIRWHEETGASQNRVGQGDL